MIILGYIMKIKKVVYELKIVYHVVYDDECVNVLSKWLPIKYVYTFLILWIIPYIYMPVLESN